MDENVDLASLAGLTAVVARPDPGAHQRLATIGTFNGTFCAHCGGTRRMQLICLFWDDRWAEGSPREIDSRTGQTHTPPAVEDPSPALFVAVCLQCQSRLTLVAHRGPQAMELVALPDTYGGLATPSTPEGVAYYLDQAQRSFAVGALSAAVAMYRSALEHLLHEQGYTEGMLAKRIAALLEDESPPPWRDRLDPEYLVVINKLGNAAIHANDGDVGQQVVFATALLAEVRELFVELLDEVYEQPARKQSRLTRLRTAADSIKR